MAGYTVSSRISDVITPLIIGAEIEQLMQSKKDDSLLSKGIRHLKK
jgi:hypothetical protein